MKSVIFDIGGVFLDWDPRYLYRKLFASEPEIDRYFEAVDFMGLNALNDKGSWTLTVEAAVDRHPAYAKELRAYNERFLETIRGTIPGSLEVLDDVRRAGPSVYALTNWAADTYELARREYRFFDDGFVDVLVSGREGVAKPNPKIFELALRRWKLAAADTVFVDDSAPNVAAACRCGIDAVLFVEPGELRRELFKRGLLPHE